MASFASDLGEAEEQLTHRRQLRKDLAATREGFFAHPGKIRVTTTETDEGALHRISDLKAFQLATTQYGLRCGGRVGYSSSSQQNLAERWQNLPNLDLQRRVFFGCEVPYGQEDLWLEILAASPSVLATDYQALETASISDEIIMPRLRAPSLRSKEIDISVAEELNSQVLSFYRSYYGRNANIRVQKTAPYRVRVAVSYLRGKVIPQSSLWERLEIDSILVPSEPNARLILVVDGYVASGAGRTPPPWGRYDDMSRRYHAQLTAHLGELSAALQIAISGGGTL